MAHLNKGQTSRIPESVLAWLLDSDPAIRWQVMQDLLERRLFRRRSTGEVIVRDRKGGSDWTCFAYPTWLHYDVLRGLEYLWQAGGTPDERVADAIDLVVLKRSVDGRWTLEAQYLGTMPVDFGEAVGGPSRWITLRALRVLNWAAASPPQKLDY